jgi:exodeoxyribonuclease VII large subunit
VTIDNTPLHHNQPEFTVSEVSTALKRTVETAFDYVRIRGEISGCKPAPSGHMYFSLKDDNAVLSAVCWKGVAAKLTFKPEDGLEVICTGRITTYAGQSKYQLIAESIAPYGIGAIMAVLEKRKKQLMAEGLFDSARKKPLPPFPSVIGIITSPTGAVIRDILHRLEERFPCQVLLWPVLVQGEQAAAQITAAINGFNALPPGGDIPVPDMLIVARGGGSIEDLLAFSEEIVVRAAAASRIPLISAVGHETDTTLIDYAADVRAPTPTAAAEMAVPVRHELLMFLQETTRRMMQSVSRAINENQVHINGLARGLPNPALLLATSEQRFDEASFRLGMALPRLLELWQQQLRYAQLRIAPLQKELTLASTRIEELTPRLKISFQNLIGVHQQQLANLAALLESYHYTKVLERGFAIVRDEAGSVVTSAKAMESGKGYIVELKDGKRDVVVEGKKGKPAAAKPKGRPEQESLF